MAICGTCRNVEEDMFTSYSVTMCVDHFCPRACVTFITYKRIRHKIPTFMVTYAILAGVKNVNKILVQFYDYWKRISSFIILRYTA